MSQTRRATDCLLRPGAGPACCPVEKARIRLPSTGNISTTGLPMAGNCTNAGRSVTQVPSCAEGCRPVGLDEGVFLLDPERGHAGRHGAFAERPANRLNDGAVDARVRRWIASTRAGYQSFGRLRHRRPVQLRLVRGPLHLRIG